MQLKAEVSIEIVGMHCDSCAKNIQEALSSLDGVESAAVGFAAEKALVVFDSEKTSLEQIEKEIRVVGYAIKNPDSCNAPAKTKEIVPSKEKQKENPLRQGIIYGLVPHIGCIAFIAASVLGATFAMEFFKPLLLNPWFFQILVGVSFLFATIASVLYLRQNNILSLKGAMRKKSYLATMYGVTIAANLFMFFVVFPWTANLDTGSFGKTATGAFALPTGDNAARESVLRLQVSIPCSGHASLISSELKKISGVTGVKFSSPNFFDVAFDAAKTSREQILSLDVFKAYSAKIVSESTAATQKIGLEGAGKPNPLPASSSLLPEAASSGCGCCSGR